MKSAITYFIKKEAYKNTSLIYRSKYLFFSFLLFRARCGISKLPVEVPIKISYLFFFLSKDIVRHLQRTPLLPPEITNAPIKLLTNKIDTGL
jgi:hypothetical protein